ncbi:MAG TPA: hypothetical protein VFK34_10115 [Marmoricola sp.]|nr:hypothetical protein [Marmoricola sp.]
MTSGAIRVVDERGLAGLSWQAVATASGMSVGEVRHRCELSRDRLVRLMVIALCRSRTERLQRAGVYPFSTVSSLQRAIAMLPRTEDDRRDVRVTAQLAAVASLPPDAERLLRKHDAEHREWCLRVMDGEPVGGAVLYAVTTGLERATSDRDVPMEVDVAEQALQAVLGSDGESGRHAAAGMAPDPDVAVVRGIPSATGPVLSAAAAAESGPASGAAAAAVSRPASGPASGAASGPASAPVASTNLSPTGTDLA